MKIAYKTTPLRHFWQGGRPRLVELFGHARSHAAMHFATFFFFFQAGLLWATHAFSYENA